MNGRGSLRPVRSIFNISAMASTHCVLLSLTLHLIALVMPQAAVVVINEVNTHDLGTDRTGFIELRDTGGKSTSLDGYVIVFFNGKTDRAYLTVNLKGTRTRSDGLFLLDDTTYSPNFRLADRLQSGVHAMALYRASASRFPFGALPTQSGLVDAVVYGSCDYTCTDNGLIQAFVYGQKQLKIDAPCRLQNVSLSRCGNDQQMNQSAFVPASATPGTPNDCSSTLTPTTGAPPTSVPATTRKNITTSCRPVKIADYLVINEVNADSPGSTDTGEFIELSDGGLGNRALDGYVVVLYAGSRSAEVTKAISLNNHVTRSNGLFIIGGRHVHSDIKMDDDFLSDTAAAVAIHRGRVTDFPRGKDVSAKDLVDAVVYTKYHGLAIVIINALLPGQERIRELETHHPADETINRCYCQPRLLSSFHLEPQTPGQPNDCKGYVSPPAFPIYINELNADTPGTDAHEFVELYDGGVGFSCLDDLALVFFSAGSKGTDDKAYRVINLSGYQTNRNGYFVVAQAAVNVSGSSSADVIFSKSFIQNGADAVALYNVSNGTHSVGSAAKREGLTDAVVYSNTRSPTASRLLDVLMPEQQQIYENSRFNAEDESISRCTRCKSSFSQAFTLSEISPGGPNDCVGFSLRNYPKQNVVINELNADNPKFDNKEFIELYDGGRGETCLYNMTLVLYNGGPPGKSWAFAYYVKDLSQYGTDENGFLLVGSANLKPDIVLSLYSLQNGADAVVLYRGSAADHPMKSKPTSSGLVDAVVYSNSSTSAVTLLALLTPGQVQVKEDATFRVGDETISRCLSNKTRDLSAFSLTVPTPRKPNNCSSVIGNPGSTQTTSTTTSQATSLSSTTQITTTVPATTTSSTNAQSSTSSTLSPSMTAQLRTNTPRPLPGVFINEISADQPGLDAYEFVELYDNGAAYTRLDGLLLVFFNGNGDSSYLTVDLNGKTTNNRGYFVVGSQAVLGDLTAPSAVSIQIDGGKYGFIQNGADAVALYRAPASKFPNGTSVTKTGLVDAVVYGTNDKDDDGLLGVLTPGGHQININLSPLTNRSISRCNCCSRSDPSSHSIRPPTPLDKNFCGGVPTSRKPTSIPLVTVDTTRQTTRRRSTSHIKTATPSGKNRDAIQGFVINEINVDQPGDDMAEFVELYDGGRGEISMNSVLLVFFNGNLDDRAYRVIDLSGRTTSSEGYFVVGTPSVIPPPHLVITDATPSNPLLQNGPDAVALYNSTIQSFRQHDRPKIEGLIDVVVYGTGDPDDQTLLNILAPGQSQVNENSTHHVHDESISRCSCCQPRSLTAFVITHPPTPGSVNACRKRNIRVQLDSDDCRNWMATDTTEVLTYVAEFVKKMCNCSFAVGRNLFADGSAACEVERLVVNALIVENEDELLDRDIKLFEDFLKATQTISIGKSQYRVSSHCCSSATPTAANTETIKDKASSGMKLVSKILLVT